MIRLFSFYIWECSILKKLRNLFRIYTIEVRNRTQDMVISFPVILLQPSSCYQSQIWFIQIFLLFNSLYLNSELLSLLRMHTKKKMVVPIKTDCFFDKTEQTKRRKKKALLDQCIFGRSSQCQSIILNQVFQTCTNETSIAFTPLKIKINKICLI